jgi:hypothetical protein
MPGISQECEFGAHVQCGMGQECRCRCHPWTQQLLREGPKKPDAKGGVRRRNVKQKVSEAIAEFPPEFHEQPEELHNTCPQCKSTYRSTDQFCRKDGTKLCLGKPCERCASPCEEADSFCWACGWKIGEKLPVLETTIESRSSNGNREQELRNFLAAQDKTLPADERIAALRAKAQELGLLKP